MKRLLIILSHLICTEAYRSFNQVPLAAVQYDYFNINRNGPLHCVSHAEFSASYEREINDIILILVSSCVIKCRVCFWTSFIWRAGLRCFRSIWNSLHFCLMTLLIVDFGYGIWFWVFAPFLSFFFFLAFLFLVAWVRCECLYSAGLQIVCVIGWVR